MASLKPKTIEEARAIDAEARLGSGKRVVVQCPVCGRGFLAGRGHLGSDFCAVHQKRRELAAAGLAPIARTYGTTLRAGGVYPSEHLAGITRVSGRFLNALASEKCYAPLWAVRVIDALEGCGRDRADRVAMLKAIGTEELADLRKALGRVGPCHHRWLRECTAESAPATAEKIAQYLARPEMREWFTTGRVEPPGTADELYSQWTEGESQ